MGNLVDWVIARLRERTTWVGLTALATAAGVSLSPEQTEAIVTVGLAVAGAIGVFTRDKQ